MGLDRVGTFTGQFTKVAAEQDVDSVRQSQSQYDVFYVV